jgi:hypothetical protein
MRNFSSFLVFTIFFLAFASETTAQKDSRGFEVPDSYVKILLVNDPNCPIQLSEPTKIIGFDDGSISRGYNMQNVSNSVIKKFNIVNFSWLPQTSYRGIFDNENFLPGMVYKSLTSDEELNLRKFNEKDALTLKLSDKVFDIWIVMVTKVTLADGTEYDAALNYEEIEDFTKGLELSNKMSPEEINLQEKKLRSFIANLIRAKELSLVH